MINNIIINYHLKFIKKYYKIYLNENKINNNIIDKNNYNYNYYFNNIIIFNY